MKYRTLGRTGLKISEIGFGAWAIGEAWWGKQPENESIDALHKALDVGVNFIDTAAGYGDGKSERIIGQVLKDRREDVIVATKTPPADGPWPPSPYCDADDRYSEKYIRQNIEERLRNLNTDCIDVLQLHTWTRAWNKNPKPLDILKKLQAEGKIKYIGLSTPEHDQNCVIDLMRRGYLDTVQVIYNIFEQEPAAELLPTALEHNVGIIVRVAFDEGILTGKYTKETKFPKDDFRARYFAGDRLERAVDRVEAIKKEIAETDLSMPQLALKYTLMHPAVSTVIPGIRNVYQAEANTAISDMGDLEKDLMIRLRQHAWLRAFWYGGK
jgi:aryl-alcohol dehydrogenase-like predicted oxidoreductase